MLIEDEIEKFDSECAMLSKFVAVLVAIDRADFKDHHRFLAEAVIFRLFRAYESFVRSTFLFYCVEQETLSGKNVSSKLKCADIDTAEEILKSGNKFLDWGKVDSINTLANLIFDKGFPVVDLLGPLYSVLRDLHRFRNFIAHDSKEASAGFIKARIQYVKVGDIPPETVGELALYRRNMRADMTLKILLTKVQDLSKILKGL